MPAIEYRIMYKYYLTKFIKENTNKDLSDEVDNIPMLSKESGITAYDCVELLLKIQVNYGVPIEALTCLDNPLFTMSDIVSDILNYRERRCDYEKINKEEI